MRIGREFFERDTLTVAKDLLGTVLVRETAQGVTKGMIVETEAYLGEIDDAAHSYKGRSERVRVQYGASGCLYVYMIYGMYYCVNITSGPPGVPEVVLLRALEPVEGLELMKERRKTDRIGSLCSGPGKLSMAIGIGREDYGADLCSGGDIYLEYGAVPEKIIESKRINIDYAVKCKDEMWRFLIGNNKYVSKPAF